MRVHRFVVFAERVRGFDTLEEARAFALVNPPAVVCERVATPEGGSQLRELFRHDFLFDEAQGEWRMMIG